MALHNVETNIPLLAVPYNHYANRDSRSETSALEGEFPMVGLVGEEILEEFIIALYVAKSTNSYDGRQLTGYPSYLLMNSK